MNQGRGGPPAAETERGPTYSRAPPPGAIAAVAFDLGGVVFRYRPERRLAAFAAATGRSPERIRKALMDSGYARSCDAGRLCGEAALHEGLRLLGQRMSYARFRDCWIAAFEPHPEVVALTRRLQGRTPLAMLTNNSELVRSGLEQRYPDVLAPFRPWVLSADIGVLKPDPRLYRTLLDLLGKSPEQVLYVDDEPACAAAAAALGMTAHRFGSPAELESCLRRHGVLP
jgi:HAD superfamily hydrolase (TIGR01509 family)